MTKATVTYPSENSMENTEVKWYLAYGSNLSSRTFIGRRGIHPLASKNVIVHGLELVFDLAGIPYNEPRFANCRIADNFSPNRKYPEDWIADDPWTGKDKLIGVAYLLTPPEFARVISTEGGGASYEMVMVDALILHSEENSTLYKDDEKDVSPVQEEPEHIKVYTLIAPTSQRPYDGKPSLRYLTIIREGANEHNLPSSYITYLNSLKPYTPYTTAQKVARVLFALIWLPIIMVVAFLGMMAGGKYRQNIQLLIHFALRNLGMIKEEPNEDKAPESKINNSANLETVKSTLEKVEFDVKTAIEVTIKSGLKSSSSISAIDKVSLTSIPLTKIELREPGQWPEWAKFLNKLVMRSMWVSYDIFWAKVFGDGEGRNDSIAR